MYKLFQLLRFLLYFVLANLLPKQPPHPAQRMYCYCPCRGHVSINATKDTWSNTSQTTSTNGLTECVLVVVYTAALVIRSPRMHYKTKCKHGPSKLFLKSKQCNRNHATKTCFLSSEQIFTRALRHKVRDSQMFEISILFCNQPV